MATVRLGLVGLGSWGRNIERALRSFNDVSLVTIARNESNPPAVDGVVIATPSATHAEVALPYIEKGIATFIEKPMATSIEDALRLQAAATASGAIVFVGHTYLYNPAFLRMLEILPTLGGVRHLICEGMNNHPRKDSSVFWDWLPHHLSMARLVFGGDPASVAAWNLSGTGSVETAIAKFSFAAGSAVSIMSRVSPIKIRRVTVSCENATLIFDDTALEKLILYRDGESASQVLHGTELPLASEMLAFLTAVRDGRGGASQIATGVAITRLIAAAEASAASGGGSKLLVS